jgi:hypothetical protein
MSFSIPSSSTFNDVARPPIHFLTPLDTRQGVHAHSSDQITSSGGAAALAATKSSDFAVRSPTVTMPTLIAEIAEPFWVVDNSEPLHHARVQVGHKFWCQSHRTYEAVFTNCPWELIATHHPGIHDCLFQQRAFDLGVVSDNCITHDLTLCALDLRIIFKLLQAYSRSSDIPSREAISNR